MEAEKLEDLIKTLTTKLKEKQEEKAVIEAEERGLEIMLKEKKALLKQLKGENEEAEVNDATEQLNNMKVANPTTRRDDNAEGSNEDPQETLEELIEGYKTVIENHLKDKFPSVKIIIKKMRNGNLKAKCPKCKTLIKIADKKNYKKMNAGNLYRHINSSHKTPKPVDPKNAPADPKDAPRKKRS